MWIRSAFLGVLALLVLPTHATSAADRVDYAGLGLTSCAEFQAFYKKEPKFTDFQFYTWYSGFATGANTASEANGLPTRDLNARFEDVVRYIRSFCDEHPMKTYMDAAINFYTSLPAIEPSQKTPNADTPLNDDVVPKK